MDIDGINIILNNIGATAHITYVETGSDCCAIAVHSTAFVLSGGEWETLWNSMWDDPDFPQKNESFNTSPLWVIKDYIRSKWEARKADYVAPSRSENRIGQTPSSTIQ